MDFWACSWSCGTLFGLLCSLDPLQLVWERYAVMTETVSLFFYVLTLLFSFLYLKQRRFWQLAIVQILSVLVISFRMSYLLVVLMSAVSLPLIAFFSRNSRSVSEPFVHVILGLQAEAGGVASGIQHSTHVLPTAGLSTTQRQASGSRGLPPAC